MPNFAGALKGEISRLARKEVRASVAPLKKVVAGLRKRVAQQKRLIAELERTTRRSMKDARPERTPAASEESQIRFSPAWVRKHRKKLNMSRRVYAKLVGVSAQSIFGWETGRSRPRRKALASWRRLRGMGVRELKALPGVGADGRGRPKRGRKKAKPTARKVKRGRPAARKRKSRTRRMRRAA